GMGGMPMGGMPTTGPGMNETVINNYYGDQYNASPDPNPMPEDGRVDDDQDLTSDLDFTTDDGSDV
ncbi:MAG TPA: hypothetical protein VKT70_10515, partial [Stellaceae bacterium]|nr:hypothetical protein [Stellaceae bacterium]